jgi:hypothetical protein
MEAVGQRFSQRIAPYCVRETTHASPPFSFALPTLADWPICASREQYEEINLAETPHRKDCGSTRIGEARDTNAARVAISHSGS